MDDYGEFVPGALKSSTSEIYGSIGRKLDLVKGYDAVMGLMTSRTHAFLELYSYGRVAVRVLYKVWDAQ